MSIKTKLRSWFFLDDDYIEEEEEYATEEVKETAPPVKNEIKKKNNIVSITSVQKSSKLIIVQPKFFTESPDIAEHIKNRRAVVINLQQTDRVEARRIIDFIGGTVYALEGEIQKIGSDIFLCTPDNVEVTGAISEELSEKFDDTRW